MENILWYTLIYIAFAPLLLYFMIWLKNYMKSRMIRTQKRSIKPPKETLIVKIKKHLNFTLKEDVNGEFSKRNITILIYVIGLVLGNIVALFNIMFSIIFLFIPYISAIYSFITSKKVIDAREKVYKRLLSLKSERMGLVTGSRGEELNINQEFQILQWTENRIAPNKIRLYIPTRFDSMAEDSFLEQFSLVFGVNGSSWVADMTDPDFPGWCHNDGIATLRMVPPLPNVAMWDERYVLNENIAWSFFPLAIGAENGVKIKDPITGKDVNILGFDVAGEQVKLANKKGIEIGHEITAAPMTLIAGSVNPAYI